MNTNFSSWALAIVLTMHASPIQCPQYMSKFNADAFSSEHTCPELALEYTYTHRFTTILYTIILFYATCQFCSDGKLIRKVENKCRLSKQ